MAPSEATLASEVTLPLRVGARTLWKFRRQLVRRRLSLEEALGGLPPKLPPLRPMDQGYLLTGLPKDLVTPLVRDAAGLSAFIRQSYRRSYAELGIGFDRYLAGLTGKTRSSLKRKARKLAQRSGGTIDLRCYRSETEIETFYRAARQVSARTYQERLLDAGLPAGQEAIDRMRALARTDASRAWLLFVEKRPAAYLYAPAEGETLIYAHLGYDPAFADLSPGTMLQLEAMRQLMEEGRFRRFDFTEGDGQHKRLFATSGLDCVDLLLLRPTWSNLMTGHLLNGFDHAIALAKQAIGPIPARLRR